jgi:hypothetical protein
VIDMSDPGSAELSVLLSQLNSRASHPSASPTSSEAMAIYAVAARLVDLQLRLADDGLRDERQVAATREILQGTHRVLTSALAHVEAHEALHPRPTLRLIVGGDVAAKPRRRRPRRYYA